MKARSAGLSLYHFDPGHHKEVCVWQDQDHKPEVVGTVPSIFLSQRWVAPPDLVAARPRGSLEYNGGEYVSLNWSTGTPEEMDVEFNVLSRRLETAARMQPLKYIHRTWGRRLCPVSTRTRPGLELSGEAVICAPQNTGLMVLIDELRDADKRAAYAAWRQSTFIPMVLDTMLFTAAVELTAAAPADRNVFVALFYTEQADPCAAYAEFIATDTRLPQLGNVRRRVHSGMYRLGTGHYEHYP